MNQDVPVIEAEKVEFDPRDADFYFPIYSSSPGSYWASMGYASLEQAMERARARVPKCVALLKARLPLWEPSNGGGRP